MGSLPLPEPLDDSPPPTVDYRTPLVGGGIHWATVASFPSAGAWHAARSLLSRQRIESRLGPSFSDSEEMALQVAATEVEWARDIISRGSPEPRANAPQARGFEVIQTSAAGARLVLPVIEIPAGPAPPAGPQSIGYRATITILWIILILIALGMVWICFL